jgi:hypothetical protein
MRLKCTHTGGPLAGRLTKCRQLACCRKSRGGSLPRLGAQRPRRQGRTPPNRPARVVCAASKSPAGIRGLHGMRNHDRPEHGLQR